MPEIIAVVMLFGTFILVRLAFRRDETTKYGAPFEPLTPDVVSRIIKLAEIKDGDIFYDLGSGDGRLVIAAALSGARAYGIEIDTARVWYSRLCILLLGLSGRAKIIQKNIFDVNLHDADAVTVYLLQETNDLLEPKLRKELKPGTRVIGAAFSFKGWKTESIEPRGPVYGPIYVYRR